MVDDRRRSPTFRGRSVPARPVTDGGSGALSVDDIFSALATERQRYLLYYLDDRDGRGTLDDAANLIAEWESGDAEVSPETREQVLTSLHHVYLPRLRDLGVLEYDERQGDIVAMRNFGRLEEYLRLARAEEVPRPDGA